MLFSSSIMPNKDNTPDAPCLQTARNRLCFSVEITMIEFKEICRSKHFPARAAELVTHRNVIPTPCFMPVGTYGAVSGMIPSLLLETGAEILVCNAFRLSEKPGESVISKFSGLHKYMGWPKTILTDSGGFQSRTSMEGIGEKGIRFNENDGEIWTPERAVQVQKEIGSDLVMPLDWCIELPASRQKAQQAMELTLRWAQRSKAAFKPQHGQTLFGIVQGAIYPDLRRTCVEKLEEIGFDAYAIGGLNVGESPQDYKTTLEHTTALLPAHKLRYIMGVGRPEAMLEAVAAGVDIMDSIIPTKYAREKTLFTWRGPFNILKRRKYRLDKYPVDPNCNCYTCRNVSRSYLYHLYRSASSAAHIYASIHNISFCISLLQKARQALLENRFKKFYEDFMTEYSPKRK